jgi:outer membrane protein TolC
LGLSFTPLLQVPKNLVGEAPRKSLIDLGDALNRSIAVSLPKEIAEKRKSLDGWNFASAIRDLFPEAKFYYDWEDGILSAALLGETVRSHYKSMEYAFELNQPLFKGFALVNTVLKEKYNRKASIAEIHKAVNEAVYDALLAYFELTRATLVYQSHAEMVKAAQKYVKMSAEKKGQGLISEIEHLNVQSIYADIASEKEILNGDKEVADLELKKALRIPPQEHIEILPLYNYSSADLESIKDFGSRVEQEASELRLGSQKTLDDYLILAYQHRSSLKMEESKLIANRYSEKIKRGKYLPEADLSMKMGRTSQYVRQKLEKDPPPFKPDWMINVILSWNLGGNTVKYEYTNTQSAPSVTEFRGGGGKQQLRNTLTYNLLDRLRDYADVKQAELDTLEQLRTYDDTERQVVQEVVEAFYNYRAAVARLRSASKGLDYQSRSAELSKLKLDKNEIEISEYLESLRDFASQRSDFHDAMADYFFSKADLNHAVGIQNFVPIQQLIEPTSQQGSES